MKIADPMTSPLAVLFLIVTGCGKPLPKASIPELGEIVSMSIILYDETDSKIICQGIVKDRNHIEEIRECLVPNEYSKDAAGLMLSGPIIGKVGIKGPRGTTWIEFVGSGKNPLCFRVGANSYLRGGVAYKGYLGDHERLYGIDSEDIAEGKCFHKKLMDICEGDGKG